MKLKTIWAIRFAIMCVFTILVARSCAQAENDYYYFFYSDMQKENINRLTDVQYFVRINNILYQVTDYNTLPQPYTRYNDYKYISEGYIYKIQKGWNKIIFWVRKDERI